MGASNNVANELMRKEALRGLAWRKEFNRGGTMVGVARARDIINGADLSLDTVKRMNSFFARHEVDKEAEGFRPGEKGYPSNGRIAWALWGGDAGKVWAKNKVETAHGGPMIFPEDEEFLAHYGAKGMKWGVRKDRSSSAPKQKKVKVVTDNFGRKTKIKVDKEDVLWAKNGNKRVDISKRANSLYNKEISKVYKKNKVGDSKDVSPGSLKEARLFKDMDDLNRKTINQAIKEAGPSPSGKLIYKPNFNNDGTTTLVPTPITTRGQSIKVNTTNKDSIKKGQDFNNSDLGKSILASDKKKSLKTYGSTAVGASLVANGLLFL